MNNTPLISIIIPVFNRENQVSKTLESILNQSFKDWECIIVDDGSTDNSLKVIEGYSAIDNRFSNLKRNRNPKGAPTCRNIGFQHAKGSYVIFFDSDDIMLQNCLETRIQMFQANPTMDFIFFPFFIKKNNGLLYSPVKIKKENLLDALISLKISFQTSATIWRKNYIESLRGWNENLIAWQDIEIHIRAVLNSNNFLIADSKPDIFYRTNDKNSITLQNSVLKSLKTTHSHCVIYKQLPEQLKLKFKETYKEFLLNSIDNNGKTSSYALLYSKESAINFILQIAEIRYLRLYFNLHHFFVKLPIIKGMSYRLRSYGIIFSKRKKFFKYELISEEFNTEIFNDRNFNLLLE